ncbi:MAG: S8 family serine peptidase, partial [Hyphomicrobium sp.]|nr:S8 family serine peptidase [Hyphomicrobium sp.]
VRLRPSRLSSRGAHISFAAPGVGLVVAAPRSSHRRVDGTSFAAPFVTAALAMSLGGKGSGAEAVGRLRAQAKDLGAPGHDPIFGWGLIQFETPKGC